jgi:hypothetical protein
MARHKTVLFLFSVLFPLYSGVYAEKVSDVVLNDDVVDKAGLLNDNELIGIRQKLKSIELETSDQFRVVIINSLEGKKIESFASDLFDQSRIGRRVKDNGLLLLISKQDREIRIEVGYGLENIITDQDAGQIIRNELAPEFKSGHFSNGINRAVDAIKNKLIRPDIKRYFSMQWDIGNFEDFLIKFPDSIQKCDALLFLGRFYEDVWNSSVIKSLKEKERQKSIYCYQRYLSECPDGIWKITAVHELSQVKNKKPDSVRYLMNH